MTVVQERAEPRPSGQTADWSFVRSPRWILSHLFVAAVICLFVLAGMWQLDRRNQRIVENERVAARADAPALTVAAAVKSGTPDEVDFRRVHDEGVWVDTDVVRVANRSLNGVAGEWVVGLFETVDGTRVLVNRGFVPLNDVIEEPIDLGLGNDTSAVSGYMRTSRIQEGLTVADTGEGTLVPRLNVEAIAARLDNPDVVGMWLQLEAPIGTGFPELIPLPEPSNGPHLSYAGQWFLFAAMGAGAYWLILRRIANPQSRTVVPPL